jgi:hypothetical protein
LNSIRESGTDQLTEAPPSMTLVMQSISLKDENHLWATMCKLKKETTECFAAHGIMRPLREAGSLMSPSGQRNAEGARGISPTGRVRPFDQNPRPSEFRPRHPSDFK